MNPQLARSTDVDPYCCSAELGSNVTFAVHPVDVVARIEKLVGLDVVRATLVGLTQLGVVRMPKVGMESEALRPGLAGSYRKSGETVSFGKEAG